MDGWMDGLMYWDFGSPLDLLSGRAGQYSVDESECTLRALDPVRELHMIKASLH